jgi:hypothetical protein
MMYVEFIERDRSMPVEIFRQLGKQGSDWMEGSADRLVLQLGRTLRLGPVPSYLAFWDIPDIGRLDSWEEYFNSPEAFLNRRSQAMHRAIHIQRAGLYDTLFGAAPGSHPLYYLEYYGAVPPGFSVSTEGLVYFLRRVGCLGPDAQGIAVWGCESYGDVEALARRQGGAPPMDAGVYKDFGTETL